MELLLIYYKGCEVSGAILGFGILPKDFHMQDGGAREPNRSTNTHVGEKISKKTERSLRIM